MSDLVERLKDYGVLMKSDLMLRAADEIERLNEKLPCGHRKIDMDDSYGGCVFCGFKDGYEEYEAEIERLNSLAKDAILSLTDEIGTGADPVAFV